MNTTKHIACVDLPRILSVASGLRTLMKELNEIFPERESFIQQIMYALLTREHVLVWGVKGTGKSDICHSLFECFEGASLFPLALSKFMTESQLIGTPDLKKMRQEGVVWYDPNSAILTADFIELDEFLDGSAPLVRTLLGILNERLFKRGRQVEKAKLHTAIACTNAEPETEIKKDPTLAAVIDRFMFQSHVAYVQEQDSRLRMYAKFLSGGKPTTRIKLEDLTYLSSIVVDANQINDASLIELGDKIIEGYCAETKDVLSDRRKCKLFQLAEATAVLNGRFQVIAEDFLGMQWAICRSDEEAKREKFVKIATKLVATYNEDHKQDVAALQLSALQMYAGKLKPVPQTGDLAELGQYVRECKALEAEVRGAVQPEGDTVRMKLDELLSDISTAAQAAMKKIEGGE